MNFKDFEDTTFPVRMHMATHGDEPDPNCPECKRHIEEFMKTLGLTPERIHEIADMWGVDEEFKEGAAIFNKMFPRVSAWDL